ncbi:hypothetical protein ILYODFUR_029832 [Ilyodon furcidens]|uniref:Uncharacterized protein n=1 Tax=Ilyodon furcidens TaxID=33524 RepID=A0ABV0TQS7_9TELE
MWMILEGSTVEGEPGSFTGSLRRLETRMQPTEKIIREVLLRRESLDLLHTETKKLETGGNHCRLTFRRRSVGNVGYLSSSPDEADGEHLWTQLLPCVWCHLEVGWG